MVTLSLRHLHRRLAMLLSMSLRNKYVLLSHHSTTQSGRITRPGTPQATSFPPITPPQPASLCEATHIQFRPNLMRISELSSMLALIGCLYERTKSSRQRKVYMHI
ncbi:hypothetical protein PV05_04394 [Exophiala xenobiotica]|uniref:Uncharacterized protein n=1 Tax=Exophiala xenobiotica TaxID=348802 RepID=A0A0D2EJR2_9EURO|nr:uncharacterized protein PV05_04394 [Exophiala xenobiotica]KIW55663.1 hypothetical protein PV05_04394 [Exophiala xenobiotica]